MADDNKAKIQIDVEGQAEAERKLKKIKDSFKEWGREIGGIVGGMVKDIGSMSMALTRVDPGSAAQKFRDYRRTVTEMSVAAGRSIGDLKNSFSALSNSTLLPDDQIASFSGQLAKMTYDFGDSSKAIEALRGSGVATGRSLEEMGGIAETLHNNMGVAFNDMPDVLGKVESAAKTLGTTGGPAALMDDLQALGGMLGQVSMKGKSDVEDLVATMAALGKGLRPEQQKQVMGAFIGTFTQGGEQLRRNLGIKREDFYDEAGNVKVNSAGVKKLQQFYLNRTGGNADQARLLASFQSPQLAAALFRPGLMDDMRKAELAAPGTAGAAALATLRATDHGRETATQIAREQETRENVGGKANAMQQAAANAMPQNSMARFLVGGIGGGISSAIVSSIGTGMGPGIATAAKAFFKIGEEGGKAAVGLTKMGGILGKMGGVAGAGIAGYEIGTLLDKKFGLSTKIANALDTKSAAKEEAGVAANLKALAEKKAARDAQVKELMGQGLTKGQALARIDHPEVKIVIQDASGHPNQVVQAHKASAGQQ